MASGRLIVGIVPLIALALAAEAGSAEPGSPADEELAPLPRECPIVDRGFIQDGVTTITELVPPAPCNAGPEWTGWWCTTLQSDANARDGPSYPIDVRWNLPTQTVAASFTWMIGGASVGFFREVTGEAERVQDVLASENVRTIEISLQGEGVYAAPANGYPSISAVYADVLEWLVANGIAEGVIGHFGNSGGGLMAANALAFHRVEQLLDGVVFGSGPFWNDMEPVCADTTSKYFGDPLTRARADSLNWLDVNGTRPCSTGAAEADPTYACRSLLGPDADIDYPDLILSIVTGTQDPGFGWFDASASDYVRRVNVYSHTYQRVASGHQMMNFVAGADTVLARIRDIVAGTTARKSAPEAAAREVGPVELRLAAPNPARGGTVLAFSVASPGRVLLTVHDVTGRRVASLLDTVRAAGDYSVRWNGTDDSGWPVASGVYFARLRAPGGQRVTRVQVVR